MTAMYESFYEKISAPWRARTNGSAVITGIDNGLRVLVASLYCMLLIWLVFEQSPLLLRAVIVPLVVFMVVSVWRAGINWPRPYEAFDITPLIKKDTQGKCMPSRHMASATIIACTLLWVAGAEGHALLWVAAVVAVIACPAIAYTRMVGGVHFPRDIIVAAIFAILCATTGFLL